MQIGWWAPIPLWLYDLGPWIRKHQDTPLCLDVLNYTAPPSASVTLMDIVSRKEQTWMSARMLRTVAVFGAFGVGVPTVFQR